MEDQVSITALILANHVEVVNGLLYVSGGGWTDHVRRVPKDGPTPISHLGIGLTVAIPWQATNQTHPFTIRVEDDDANMVADATGQFNVGRPPTIPPGSIQFAVLGLTFDAIFPHPGGYRVIARVDENGDKKLWPFRVHNVTA